MTRITGKMLHTGFVLLFSCQLGWLDANIPRPRGVAISKAGAYDPNKSFHCFDGSKTVPFEYVNDDYCDCPDGSDEPGTAACPNGKFHCTNAGHVPLNIVSSRVNDGICDCCDGADEYEGIISCSNNCKELGKKAREEAEKMKSLFEQGVKLKVEYSDQGKQAKQERKTRLEELERDRLVMENTRNDLEAKKTEAETPEKEAKDKHQQNWDAEKTAWQSEKDKVRGEEAFNELDTNNDRMVDIQEMVVHMEFDIDSNGVVSDEEAKEYMEEVEQANLEHFQTKMWPNIKDIYRLLVQEPPPGPPLPDSDQIKDPPTDDQVTQAPGSVPGEEFPPPVVGGIEDEDDDDHEEEEDDDYDEDEDLRDEDLRDEDMRGEPKGEDEKKEENEEPMPEYDEETQALMKNADEARAAFTEADDKLKNIDKEISDINSFLDLDLGLDDEYFPLKEKCFEMTDREYVYKLCPYDKATQRAKSGGAETTLGNWGHWDGTEEDKYSRMKYERGQHCWNGPDRSVEVILHCGLENTLTSASEPNRCEYQFDFNTPAQCKQTDQSEGSTHEPHIEL